MPQESRTDTDTDPRIGEEQLEALQALAEFEDVELRALREIVQERASEYVDRRSLIKSAGALTGMGIAGSVGYNEGVSQAKADASTSDSDGDIGTPSNPVDVFADGIAASEINSTQYVAPGDSVQAAVDALPAGNVSESEDGGGTVVLEAGEHDISTEAPIDLPFGATVEGAGEKATKVLNTSANASFRRDNGGGTTNPDRVAIKDLQIVSDGSASASIRFVNVHNWYVENVTIDTHTRAFHMTASWLGTIVDCRTKNNTETGLFDQGADGDTNAIRVKGGSFHDDGPMTFEDGHGIFIHGGAAFEHAGAVALRAGPRNRAMDTFVVRDCYFENAGADAAYIDLAPSATYSNNVRNAIVEGCEFNTNSPHVSADRVDGLTIRENEVDGGNPAFDLLANCSDVTLEDNRIDTVTQTVANASTDALIGEYAVSQFKGRLQEAFDQVNSGAVIGIDENVAGLSGGDYTLATNGVTVRGQGRGVHIDGRGGSALIIQGTGVAVENVRVSNNSDGGGSSHNDVIDVQANEVSLRDIWITEADGDGILAADTFDNGTIAGVIIPSGTTIDDEAIQIGGDGWTVTGCSIEVDRILLNANSNNCAVAGCRVSGGVTNNGTGNATAGNS